MKNSEIKIGMWAVCLPGFNTSDRGEFKGGCGYEEDLLFKISGTYECDNEIIATGVPDGGIWARALRPATEWEIEHKQIQKDTLYEIY